MGAIFINEVPHWDTGAPNWDAGAIIINEVPKWVTGAPNWDTDAIFMNMFSTEIQVLLTEILVLTLPIRSHTEVQVL